MARATGIHLAGRSLGLVAIEGSAKRPKVRVALTERTDDAEAPLDALSDLLKGHVKREKKRLPTDEVELVVDAGLAAFRDLTLPFSERGKIEEVLKFEIESKLPHWDIDDVVVDFHVVKSTPVESKLLVTAVPKDELGERLEACTSGGIEPTEAELETTALFAAARYAEAMTEDAAQVLVHLGPRTASLVVTEGGELRAMRALHLDLEPPAAAVAEEEPDAAAEIEAALEGLGGEEPAEPGAPPSLPAAVDPEAERVRLERHLERLKRELVRTMTGVRLDKEIEAIYVCGETLPGLVGSDVLGVEVRALDPLAGLVELPEEERLRLVPAFGGALRRLGGTGIQPHLRREELTYASTFERLELPLGVLGLLLLTLLAARFIINRNYALDRLEQDMQVWVWANSNYLLGDRTAGEFGYLPAREPGDIEEYAEQVSMNGPGDEIRNGYEQLRRMRTLLDLDIEEYKKQIGTSGEVTQPLSALLASTLVLETIGDLGDRLGRFSIRRIESEYQAGRSGRDDACVVELDMSFFGEAVAASAAFDLFQNTVRGEPWCVDFPLEGTRSMEGAEGVYANDLKITVNPRAVGLD